MEICRSADPQIRTSVCLALLGCEVRCPISRLCMIGRAYFVFPPFSLVLLEYKTGILGTAGQKEFSSQTSQVEKTPALTITEKKKAK
jgi:hypothetical protein